MVWIVADVPIGTVLCAIREGAAPEDVAVYVGIRAIPMVFPVWGLPLQDNGVKGTAL